MKPKLVKIIIEHYLWVEDYSINNVLSNPEGYSRGTNGENGYSIKAEVIEPGSSLFDLNSDKLKPVTISIGEKDTLDSITVLRPTTQIKQDSYVTIKQ